MLLTSGQVSVAISSIVVFLFTAALFLSGYVLQQKTVRDIRIAIRPQAASMQERMYLPPQFEKSQIQIQQGQDSEVVVNVKQSTRSDESNTKSKHQPRGESLAKYSTIEGTEKQKGIQSEDSQSAQAESHVEQPPALNVAKSADNEAESKPLSAAARRKKIKEEVLAAGEGEGYKGYRRRMW